MMTVDTEGLTSQAAETEGCPVELPHAVPLAVAHAVDGEDEEQEGGGAKSQRLQRANGVELRLAVHTVCNNKQLMYFLPLTVTFSLSSTS